MRRWRIRGLAVKKLDELTQILYEISMSIGTSLSLDRMLRDVALVTLRKLNSTALVVFQQRQDGDRYHFERVYMAPRGFIKSSDYAAFEQILPHSLASNGSETFYAALPKDVALETGGCLHLMALPGYGLIALFRAHGFLPQPVIHSFASLNNKLAVACQACLAHEHLEETVKARTSEIEAKNRELETFTYSVAHDLKAPLRGIDGYSMLLSEEYADKLDEEGLQFLNNVRNSAQQMSQLIEDLLSYSRMERRETQMTRVELAPLIELLISERKHDIESRLISISVNLPFDAIDTDPDTVRQVVRNYLDNAIKFSQKAAQSAVKINGHESDSAWTIWVEDNGIGFDQKYHDRIFQIFQRLHRSEDYPGTGVGLAIARKAVERIGGYVWAESAPGKSAKFFMKIPKKL